MYLVVTPALFLRCIITIMVMLQNGDPRVAAYLRGEEIAAPELAGKSGFAALLYEGAPLGGGKAVDGRLKNHYPKGLRTHT